MNRGIQEGNEMSTKKLTLAALFIALGIALPFVTGQIPQIGSMLLPMHIPVLLSGFVLGGPLGFLVGLITPLLRSVLFTMPPMIPVALAMAPELGVYGLVSGLVYRRFPANEKGSLLRILSALIAAMIAGRVVWGLAMWLLLRSSGGAFSFQAFLAGAFVNAVPGIAVQLVLIPILVSALHRAGYIDKE